MISVKFWFISFFIFLTIISVSPYPNPTKRNTGDTASASFPDVNNVNTVTGEVHFTEISDSKVRMTGQFNTGFPNGHPDNYQFEIIDKEDKVIMDVTDDIKNKLQINVPGTAPFECDISGLTIKDIIGKYLLVKRRQYVEGGKAEIKKA
ncbi:2097_t:CDS:1 [Dentiscutata heterogama]|uniref:2097_t:CDS:1 n=1 Tax=Dentiscutata heterogama TaxID=1316150 RepID=A0ACA9KD13_9GLOM|nr:2097_t:CDS:1 [Dentiscutata heterogama]